MDGRRHLAGGARHAAIGHQRHAAAGILQHAHGRRQRMQLRHAVGTRPLEAQHRHKIAIELAFLESLIEGFLRIEDQRRRFHRPVFRLDGGYLHHGAAQITLHQAQPAIRRERFGSRPHHADVARHRRRRMPDHRVASEQRLGAVTAQAIAHDSAYILMQQPGVEQFPNHETGAARRMKMIHVRFAVRIDAC